MPNPNSILGLREAVRGAKTRREETVGKPSGAVDKPGWEEFASRVAIRSGRKIIPFTPYEWQRELLEGLRTHPGCVVAKTRQVGATEFVASWLLWKAFGDPAYTAVVFSKNQEDSSDVAKRVRMMATAHPDCVLETENLKDLKLAGGGRILFKPSTPNAARGLPSVCDLFFDEAAFVDGISEIYGSALPATEMLGEEARVIVVSTPNGRNGFYWDRLNEDNGDRDVLETCRRVREGEIPPCQSWTDEGGWLKFVVHWRAHPVYSSRPDYLAGVKRRGRLTDSQLQQEYNLGFAEGAASVYPLELVERAARGIWQPLFPRARYVAAIDPNFGGGDYFTCLIFRIDIAPYSLVAEFRQNRAGKLINIDGAVRLLSPYRGGLMGLTVEGNGGGNLYAADIASELPWLPTECVSTGEQNKILNTDRLLLLLERDLLIFPRDSALRREMPNFRETRSGSRRSRGAATGHDDSVMAAALAFSDLPEIDAKIWGTALY